MTLAPNRRRAAIAIGLLLTLLALGAHAAVYAFLCDDAFISFRYARNLAEGHGLVFNPGFERVEGYTNFLWVVVLAGLDAIGCSPERAANPILLTLTAGLWGSIAWFAWRSGRPGEPAWPALVAPALLAATRSIAVWSTSGLETRLFELLVVAGVLRLVVEIESELAGPRRRAPLAVILLALATLTRPDGLLIAGCVLGAGHAYRILRGPGTWRRAFVEATLFAAIVGAHLLWRHAYYGDWLPNTYYAKVAGRTWWSMGAIYLAGFVLEYGVPLWVPLVAAGVIRSVRTGVAHVPLLFAAAVLPHALYVASIGGDHFEYRPLDLYFPFAFLLMGEGARRLARRAPGTVGAVALVLIVALGLVWIPWRSHREFPEEYIAGFPGVRPSMPEASRYLDPESDPLMGLPGIARIAEAHRAAVRSMTSRFVGVRQEEHRIFHDVVQAQAGRLERMIEEGAIPRDAHIAISAVGVIPYVTDLRTLDRLGLTDPVVARSEPDATRILAHDKHATFDYARAAGVDFWSADPVLPILAFDDGRLAVQIREARATGEEILFASLGDAVLAGRFPQGDEAGRRRFAALAFRSSLDPGVLDALDRRILDASRTGSAPGSIESRVAAAHALASEGKSDEAIAALEALSAGEGGDSLDVFYGLGSLCLQAGRFEDAVEAFSRAVAIRADVPDGWLNLGVAQMRLERWERAAEAFDRAIALDPDHAEARFSAGVAALMLGQRDRAASEAAALRALDSPRSRELAARLESVLTGRSDSGLPK